MQVISNNLVKTKSNSFDEVQDEIVDLLTEENGDQKFIFLTGAAGTGKTTLLERVKIQVDKKKMVVAPTGLAALNYHQLCFQNWIRHNS